MPHGGKRRGAGRKRRWINRMRQVTVRLPAEFVAELDQEARKRYLSRTDVLIFRLFEEA